MLDYMKRAVVAARSKWTTYGAMALSGLAVLPEVIPQYWADVESLIPTQVNKETVHHLLLAAGSLAVIWLRIRREIKPPT